MTPLALRALLGAELRMVARDTAGLVVPIALPLLLLVSNAMNLGGEAVGAYLLPLVLVIVVATVGVVNTPSFLATYRRSGVLRRLAVTPVHPAAVLGAQLLVGVAQIMVGVLLACLVAVLGFGTPLPADWMPTLAALLLGAGALFSVGMVVAALAPTANSALAIGLVTFFALGSVGGMFGPVQNLPAAVAAAGEALPFGASLHALSSAWNGGGLPAADLARLGLTILLCSLVSIRWFRWT